MGASDHSLGLEPADQAACLWALAHALSQAAAQDFENTPLLQHIWPPAPESQQLCSEEPGG